MFGKRLRVHESTATATGGPHGLFHFIVVQVEWIFCSADEAICATEDNHLVLIKIVEVPSLLILEYKYTRFLALIVRS